MPNNVLAPGLVHYLTGCGTLAYGFTRKYNMRHIPCTAGFSRYCPVFYCIPYSYGFKQDPIFPLIMASDIIFWGVGYVNLKVILNMLSVENKRPTFNNLMSKEILLM